MTIKILTIFLLGFAAGACACLYLNQYIEQQVAAKLDDIKTLQSAGYIPSFVDSNEFARIE